MELNPEITEVLRSHKIDKDEGLLCLLGFYFKLDVDSVCPERIVKAINLTKIVEKDFRTNSITWNMPLFKEQEIAFAWVKEWVRPFGQRNPDRLGSWQTATVRMKEFFAKNPEYRKEDVYKARDMYLASVKDPQFIRKSHKFIYDGAGVNKSSDLLTWCERLKQNGGTTSNNSQMRGKLL